MHQAVVSAWGEKPKYVEVPDLPPPTAEEERIKVLAVGIHRVVRSRALGRHYSSGVPPHVPGIDGVGTTESGKQVYFFTFGKGVLSEHINIAKSAVFDLPEGVNPVEVAGEINAAMSSWMAFKARTTNLPEDFTVLILGATSASGRVAASLARALGAKRVIGVGRNQETLDALGLDRTIKIQEDLEKTDFSDLDDVDVVLDYIYGPLAIHLFKALKTPKPVQYVEIGMLAGIDNVLDVPGAILRSKNITIRGSGPGAWDMKEFTATLPELLALTPSLAKPTIKVVKFEDVEKEWDYTGAGRLVFVP